MEIGFITGQGRTLLPTILGSFAKTIGRDTMYFGTASNSPPNQAQPAGNSIKNCPRSVNSATLAKQFTCGVVWFAVLFGFATASAWMLLSWVFCSVEAVTRSVGRWGAWVILHNTSRGRRARL
jgi:hypothetical protein